jgi:RNA polymerase sigma-70 factor (ECF subfamily)|tara:strand:- start:519 stop:1118 length:600 start_codon:yes stop_codon:yes gene_type:complete
MDQHPDWNKYLEKVGHSQDKVAFAALFTHFSPLLKSFLLKAGGQNFENVEELVQETMIKVWNKAANFSASHGSASTWIYTIARNTRIDAIRKISRQRSESLNAEDIYYINEEQTPDSSLIQIRNRDSIREKLLELPTEQSEVLSLMFFQGKSNQQSADVLNIPLGTVKSRVRLALAKMKLGLSPENSDTSVLEEPNNDQ